MKNSELQENKFTSFLKMTFNFKKDRTKKINTNQLAMPIKKSDIKQTIKTEQEDAAIKLDNLFESIIKSKNEEKTVMVLERGYHINSQQALIMMRNFNKDNPIITEAIQKRYRSHIENEIKNEMQDFNNEYKENALGNTDNYELEEILERLDYFARKATLVWGYCNQIDRLQDALYALEFKDDCETMIDIFNECYIYKIQGHYTKEEIEFSPKFIELLKLFTTDIERNHSEAIKNKFYKELDTYAAVFNNFETVKENMVAGILENVKKFTEFDLPKEAQKEINEITKIINEINTSQLNQIQTLELDNLYKKRLPQVLEEYISISSFYKEKLKLHDKDPDELLIESLTEIKKGITSIGYEMQEDSFNRMKATNNYLKKKIS